MGRRRRVDGRQVDTLAAVVDLARLRHASGYASGPVDSPAGGRSGHTIGSFDVVAFRTVLQPAQSNRTVNGGPDSRMIPDFGTSTVVCSWQAGHSKVGMR